MDNRWATIYCLRDPRTRAIHYVGVTRKVPFTKRWSASWRRHAEWTVDALGLWFRDLIASDVGPLIEALQTVPIEKAAIAEVRWIRRLRRAGEPLCNRSDGGETGVWGKVEGAKRPRRTLTDRQREALKLGLTAGADARRGKPLSPTQRAKISGSLRGRASWNKGTTRPPEEYATRRGRVQSPEERAARSHPAWNRGTGKAKPPCADCGALLRDSRSTRCKRCAALARTGGACKRGHPLTPENTIRSGNRGGRACRTCHNERRRKGAA